MSISLLLVVESLKMLLDLESDYRGRLISQVVVELLSVHVG